MGLDKGLKDQEGQTQVSGSVGLVGFFCCWLVGFFGFCFLNYYRCFLKKRSLKLLA